MEKPIEPIWYKEYETKRLKIINLEGQLDRIKKEIDETQKEFTEKYSHLEDDYKKYEDDLRKWRNTAIFRGQEYLRAGGFLRTIGNLDWMLEHRKWDARNKNLKENIEFDAHDEGVDIKAKVIDIEDITEPIITNYSKESGIEKLYTKIAHMSNGDIIAFRLKDDGTFPNIPWELDVFRKVK